MKKIKNIIQKLFLFVYSTFKSNHINSNINIYYYNKLIFVFHINERLEDIIIKFKLLYNIIKKMWFKIIISLSGILSFPTIEYNFHFRIFHERILLFNNIKKLLKKQCNFILL